MSRATSKRAASKRDWPALLQALRDEQTRVTPEADALWLCGKWSDPRPNANDQYLDAFQSALEGRDSTNLLRMLDAGMPLSELLLPVLAEVIRDAKQGRSDGRPSQLTDLSDITIRDAFDLFTRPGWKNKGEAVVGLAELLGVSDDTIRRSLKRTKPTNV